MIATEKTTMTNSITAPPSLKEQALSLVPESGGISMRRSYSPNELLTIRAALESLPND